MKPSRTPLTARHAAISTDARIVIASEVGAHLDSDVVKGGGTDDTALIQSILDRAPKLGSLKLIVDGAILVTGLRVHSNTTIECLNRDCGFYLVDNSDRPIIINATPQPEGRADRNLSFLGGTYNGNAAHQAHTTKEYGWTTAVTLHGVEQVLFRDVSITNSRTFAVYLTNWRRVVFENIYINLDQIPTQSNQDGIHFQGPGEFLSIRNVQGRCWDDFVALNADDTNGDWDLNGNFVRNKGSSLYAGIGPITDVDIDGVQADDCAQVIRVMSRVSRIDRVSIRNVRGTYRTFGVSVGPFYREGGDFGQVEFQNIDLRAVAPNAYEYLPPYLFYVAGKLEHLSILNVASYQPIDDRPVLWVAPEAKADFIELRGLRVYDQRELLGSGPLVRADGDVNCLLIKDVVVQRPKGSAPAGALLATGRPRDDFKKNLEWSWVAPLIKTDPDRNQRGWPEAHSYLERPGTIRQLMIEGIVAQNLARLVDHQLGKIERLHVANVQTDRVDQIVAMGNQAQIGLRTGEC